MSNTPFEKTVRVEAHANYGAFRGDDRKFYKPVDMKLTLEDFKVGQTYNIKGYSSESGKTNYITMILNGAPAAAAPVSAVVAPTPVAAPRRLALTKGEPVVAGDDKGLTLAGGRRDFKKEAKGKTVSLFIAAILHSGNPTNALEIAEGLVNKMDEKGYF